MSLPKKGLRKIEVAETQFGWAIRKRPTYSQGAFNTAMTIAIRNLDTNTPTILHVTLDVRRPDNWLAQHQIMVTPRIIKDIILDALRDGWKSDAGGAVYAFEYSITA